MKGWAGCGRLHLVCPAAGLSTPPALGSSPSPPVFTKAPLRPSPSLICLQPVPLPFQPQCWEHTIILEEPRKMNGC